MIILSASGISKAYGTDVILKDISFHVNEGDRVGMIGGNGAGKTTLMNILAGRIKPDEGDVFVSGDLSVGYLAQRDEFNSDKTVIEEVGEIFRPLELMEKEMEELNHRIASAPPEEQDALWDRLTRLQTEFDRRGGYTYRSEMNGILTSMAFGEEYYGQRTDSLSGGERTRLALACLLMKKPDLLL
ncbi:MAG: ABC-F family ATP-binding cassette domain-containing protein, partial [Firmicutes bacterium]|nr:ABC-F family ATP-binding cassette domain-containing protein [Bacillota bacterium]